MKLKKVVEYEIEKLGQKWFVMRRVMAYGWVNCKWCNTNLEIVQPMDEIIFAADSLEELLKTAKAEGYEIADEEKK